MKRYVIIQIISVFAIISSVNAQWQWAKQIGGNYSDGAFMRLDANNNIYCNGDFTNACYFQNDTLYSNGYNDAFLAKFDASGNELWARGFGGSNSVTFLESSAGRIAIDDNNNCLYLTGSFYNSMTIDGNTITGIGLDIFLAKFDFSGTCVWLKRAGSNTFTSEDRPSAIGTDAGGNVYWTGILKDNGTVVTNSVNKGTFLAKLDGNGNLLWTRNEMLGVDPFCLHIANNEIFISGTTRNDTIVIDTMTIIRPYAIDAFIAKTDTTGSVLWARSFGGNSDDYGTTLELGTNNDIFFVGMFNDSLFIDNDTLTNNGNYDMFFARFDSNGNLIWINQLKATGVVGAWGYDIAKDPDGKFYITGYFGGNADFDTLNVTSSTVQDAFVARYDDTGGCLGVRHFGEAQGNSVQVDNNGNVIVAGDFQSNITIGSSTFTSYGSNDIFLAKSDAIVGIGEGEGRMGNKQLIIYANPTAGKCNITVPDDFLHEKKLVLSIYDNTGKLIQQKALEMNEGKIKLNLEAEAKGVYNVTLSNGKKSYNGKIVFE